MKLSDYFAAYPKGEVMSTEALLLHYFCQDLAFRRVDDGNLKSKKHNKS